MKRVVGFAGGRRKSFDGGEEVEQTREERAKRKVVCSAALAIQSKVEAREGASARGGLEGEASSWR